MLTVCRSKPSEKPPCSRIRKLVEVSGIEPPTSSLRTTRSSQLSYTPEEAAIVSTQALNLSDDAGRIEP